MDPKRWFPPPRGKSIEQCHALFDPLSPQVIHDVAIQEGWRLPPDYLRFLLDWNGFKVDGADIGFSCGEVDVPSNSLQVQDDDPNEVLLVLFGVGTGLDDLRYMQSSYFFHELRRHGDYLSIGCCLGKAVLCLSMNSKDFGVVYCWESSDYDLVEPPEMLLRVASSFMEFWKKLAVRKVDPFA